MAGSVTADVASARAALEVAATPAGREDARARLRDTALRGLLLLSRSADGGGDAALGVEDALWALCYHAPLQTLRRAGDAGGAGAAVAALLNEAVGAYHGLLTALNGAGGDVPDDGKDDDEEDDNDGVQLREGPLRGRCLLRLGDIARYRCELLGASAAVARGYYASAVAQRGSAARAYNQLGLLLGKAPMPFAALVHFLCSLVDDPTLPLAHSNIRAFWSQQQQQHHQADKQQHGILSVLRPCFAVPGQTGRASHGTVIKTLVRYLPHALDDAAEMTHAAVSLAATWHCASHRATSANGTSALATGIEELAGTLLACLATLVVHASKAVLQDDVRGLATVAWVCELLVLHAELRRATWTAPARDHDATPLASRAAFWAALGRVAVHIVGKRVPSAVARSPRASDTAPRRTPAHPLLDLIDLMSSDESDGAGSDGDESEDDDTGEQSDALDAMRNLTETHGTEPSPVAETIFLAAFHPARPLPRGLQAAPDAARAELWREAAVMRACLRESDDVEGQLVWHGETGQFEPRDGTTASAATTTTTAQPPEARRDRHSKLMKRMAEELLKDKVGTLEQDLAELKLRNGQAAGAEVAVDASILLGQFDLLKRLVESKQAVVHIPHAAIEELDAMKRGDAPENRQARKAIHFLEGKLKGSRSFVKVYAQEDAHGSLPELCEAIAAASLARASGASVEPVPVLLWSTALPADTVAVAPEGSDGAPRWRMVGASEVKEIAARGDSSKVESAEPSIRRRLRGLSKPPHHVRPQHESGARRQRQRGDG